MADEGAKENYTTGRLTKRSENTAPPKKSVLASSGPNGHSKTNRLDRACAARENSGGSGSAARRRHSLGEERGGGGVGGAASTCSAYSHREARLAVQPAQGGDFNKLPERVAATQQRRVRGMLTTLFLLLAVGPVGEVLALLEGAGVVATVLVSAAVAGVGVAVVGVGDHLVALGVLLLGQQLLQGDDAGEDQGELADDEGLEGEEGEGTESQGDEGGSLQLQEQQEGQEHLQLLLLATGLIEGATDVGDGAVGDLQLQGAGLEEAGNAVDEEGLHLGVAFTGVLGQRVVELVLAEGTARGLAGGLSALDQGDSVSQGDVTGLADRAVNVGEGTHLHAEEHVLVAALLEETVDLFDAILDEGAVVLGLGWVGLLGGCGEGQGREGRQKE